MVVRVCDICQKNYPRVHIKHNIKAKRFYVLTWGWDKIDVCQDCLDKIIKAKEESEDASSTL